MKHVDPAKQTIAIPGRKLGYVLSGQYAADVRMDEAKSHWRSFCFARRFDDRFMQREYWRLAILSYRSARNLQQAVKHYE